MDAIPDTSLPSANHNNHLRAIANDNPTREEEVPESSPLQLGNDPYVNTIQTKTSEKPPTMNTNRSSLVSLSVIEKEVVTLCPKPVSTPSIGTSRNQPCYQTVTHTSTATTPLHPGQRSQLNNFHPDEEPDISLLLSPVFMEGGDDSEQKKDKAVNHQPINSVTTIEEKGNTPQQLLPSLPENQVTRSPQQENKQKVAAPKRTLETARKTSDIPISTNEPVKKKGKPKKDFALADNDRQLAACKAIISELEDKNNEQEKTIRTLRLQLSSGHQALPLQQNSLQCSCQKNNSNHTEIELLKLRMEMLEIKMEQKFMLNIVNQKSATASQQIQPEKNPSTNQKKENRFLAKGRKGTGRKSNRQQSPNLNNQRKEKLSSQTVSQPK